MPKLHIAIVGATGLVGRTFLQVLEEYQVEVGTLKLFASKKSLGKEIIFNGKSYYVKTIQEGSFKGIDVALFSAGADTSKVYAEQAVGEGAIVIDNSSAFRMTKKVPLVVPEVNLEDAFGKQLIANPNCSTIQAVVPLYALQKAFGITAVEYNTYQAVSGSGQKGLDDLHRTKEGLRPAFYPYNISETCIPQIDDFVDDGYTKEEHKMMNETRKILHTDIPVSATCVRVPVAHSHAVSIRVTLQQDVTVTEVREALEKQPGLVVVDNPAITSYPVSTLSNGKDNIYVGRIRKDKINPKTVLLYTVADNIRKGAASNAIQIMLGVMNHVKSS